MYERRPSDAKIKQQQLPERLASLGIMGEIEGPHQTLRTSQHSIVLKVLGRALIWASPIMPRDTSSLRRQVGKFFSVFGLAIFARRSEILFPKIKARRPQNQSKMMTSKSKQDDDLKIKAR